MTQLSVAGQQAIKDIAQRHGFSVDATLAMLDAVVRGNGSMAQFSHPEFGGSGQWMRGGMTMVGNMFDNQLKGWVDALCQDLAHLVAGQPDLSRGIEPAPMGSPRHGGSGTSGFGTSGFGDLFMPGSRRPDDWWPGELGAPNASGSQDGARYAYFAGLRRLLVQVGGETTVYDTGDHAIGGVSQQRSAAGSLAFTSQHGPVDLASLPVVPGAAAAAPAPATATPPLPPGGSHDTETVLAAIERLAAMKQKGILSEDEFATKKAELLRRV